MEKVDKINPAISRSDGGIDTHCGFVAIIGRPNVGKSTLLNHLLEQKISITSRKPQTTRHRIHGITSHENHQIIYVDTPGLNLAQGKALNRAMNETVYSVIKDVDLVLFIVERFVWNEADQRVLEALSQSDVRTLLILNKIDLVKDKRQLLPHIDKVRNLRTFAEIIPVSALNGHNLSVLESTVCGFLPKGPFLFPVDQVTDRSSRFLASELIREKVTRQLGDEVPYEVTVEIEKFEQQKKILHIHGLILVDRKGQKNIIVGSDGGRLKQIGTAARSDLEVSFNTKVMLNLWVKVKSGWSDDQRALKSLGYIDR
jgi:GTP-binding protein Era